MRIIKKRIYKSYKQNPLANVKKYEKVEIHERVRSGLKIPQFLIITCLILSLAAISGAAYAIYSNLTTNIETKLDKTSRLTPTLEIDPLRNTNEEKLVTQKQVTDYTTLIGLGGLSTNQETAIQEFKTATDAGGRLTDPLLDAKYLLKSGGTLSSTLTLSASPSNNLHASTKKYVDDAFTGLGANYYSKTEVDSKLNDQKLVGNLGVAANNEKLVSQVQVTNYITSLNIALTNEQVGLLSALKTDTDPGGRLTTAGLDATYIQKAGGTLTGDLVLPSSPTTNNNGAVHKKYVDDEFNRIIDGTRTFTGKVRGVTPVASDTDDTLVTKGYAEKYVDDKITALTSVLGNFESIINRDVILAKEAIENPEDNVNKQFYNTPGTRNSGAAINYGWATSGTFVNFTTFFVHFGASSVQAQTLANNLDKIQIRFFLRDRRVSVADWLFTSTWWQPTNTTLTTIFHNWSGPDVAPFTAQRYWYSAQYRLNGSTPQILVQDVHVGITNANIHGAVYGIQIRLVI